MIDIWEPKYSNNTARVNVLKVKDGENLLRFTKSKAYKDMVFSFDGDMARKCEKKPNGRGWVYEIPMKDLKNITPDQEESFVKIESAVSSQKLRLF